MQNESFQRISILENGQHIEVALHFHICLIPSSNQKESDFNVAALFAVRWFNVD